MRAAELETLAELLRLATAGTAGMRIVRGPAGIGKSWLVEHLCALASSGPEAGAQPVRVLRATGHPTEQGLPFAGLHQLLATARSEMDSLPEPQRSALHEALALGPAPRRGRAARSVSPRLRFATAAALHTLLTQLAETAPVLAVADDAHWMDLPSRQALLFAGRRLASDAVALVLTIRTELSCTDLRGLPVLDLTPLDHAAARRLLRHFHPDLCALTAEVVVDLAAGIPLALREIPRALTAEQRRGDAPVPAPPATGVDQDQPYRDRICRLPPRTQLALTVAAMDSLSAARLATALNHLELTLADLGPAESAGIVSLAVDPVRFAHPLARTATQALATADELLRAHAALARLPGEPLRRAWHMHAMANGPNAKTRDALRSAAMTAEASGAAGEAGTAWLAAAGHSRGRASRRELWGNAVRCLTRAGMAGPLARALECLVADVDPVAEPGVRARLEMIRFAHAFWTPQAGPQIDELVRIAEQAAPSDPSAAADLLTALAHMNHVYGYDRTTTQRLSRRARAIIDGGTARPLAAAYHDLFDLLAGVPGAGAVLRGDWTERVTADELRDVGLPVVIPAAALIWIDEPRAALRVLHRAIESMRLSGAVSGIGVCMGAAAQATARLGGWSEAEAEFDLAAQMCSSTDFLGPLPHILARHAYLRASRGDEDGCQQLLARATVGSGPVVEHLVRCVRGRLALSLGRHDEAVAELRGAAELEAASGLAEPGYTTRAGDLIEALWRLDEIAAASAELDRYERHGRRAGRAGALAIASRCRGLLTGDEEYLADAIAWHDRAPDIFERARTLLGRGELLRRRRAKARARPYLRDALATFETLGAHAWARRARSELAACGERRADLEAPGLDLTPQELRVAVAVARGASNPQVARALGLSRRTVEFHLANVYRKLGVARRGDLSGALAPVKPSWAGNRGADGRG